MWARSAGSACTIVLVAFGHTACCCCCCCWRLEPTIAVSGSCGSGSGSGSGSRRRLKLQLGLGLGFVGNNSWTRTKRFLELCLQACRSSGVHRQWCGADHWREAR